MQIGVLLAGFGLLVVGCGGETSSKATGVSSHTDDAALQGSSAGSTASAGASAGSTASAGASASAGSTASSSACIPPSAADAGPGACSVGRAFVDCEGPNGGCSCLSDDPTKCAGCNGEIPGPLTCVSQCAPNEYAVSCGGPPWPGRTYEDMPAQCSAVSATPGGNVYACCPCQ